jgi:hypothetical protein
MTNKFQSPNTKQPTHVYNLEDRTYLFARDVRLFLLSGHYNLDFRIYLKFVFCCLEFI